MNRYFQLCLFAALAVGFAVGGPARSSATEAPKLPWDSTAQGGYLTALCGDRSARIWCASESEGVWRYDPLMERWTHFTQSNTSGGLGDDDVYSLACDRLGRVWCGTGRDGVSVFNGSAWKTYGRLTGPLGCHIVALCTSPLTGDVWGCTENGLFEYVLKTNVWRYFNRADGLPSDQTDCLCFDKAGSLYVGTLCDGIAIASAADNYHAWRTVRGPGLQPSMPGGNGLPTSEINCLLAARGGTVYAGTTMGLALTTDSGRHWRFLRGADWKDKLAGLYKPITPQDYDPGIHLLTEDYITALAEDHSGHLYVGHRQKGLQVYDEETTDDVTPAGGYGGYVNALLATNSGRLLIGTYGDGMSQTNGTAPSSEETEFVGSTTPALLPKEAPPPSSEQLAAMLSIVKHPQSALRVGSAVFDDEDWQTQGDSLGHYGRQYALLCAADAPLDHDIISDPNYDVQLALGPHHSPEDSIRRWVTWAQTDNPKSLYDPIPGCRRQSEADDHGESTVGPNDSFAYEGPDVWATVTVPKGLQRLSVYDFNKDGGPGGGGDNRYRDYSVDVLAYRDNADDVQTEAPLAHARIRNFWGGVYESFLVRGPARYVIRVAKNGSFNTVLAGVFIDSVSSASEGRDCNAWMGGVRYSPPDPDAPTPPDPHLLDKILAVGDSPVTSVERVGEDDSSAMSLRTISSARALWDSASRSGGTPVAVSTQNRYRILAYRTVVQADASERLIADWRWALHIWRDTDRQLFEETTHKAHASLLALNADMLNHSY